MYNRYIPNGSSYTRVAVEEEPGELERERAQTRRRREEEHSRPGGEQEHPGHAGEQSHSNAPPGGRPNHGRGQNGPAQDLFDNLTAPFRFLGGEDKNAGITGILKALNLEDLDSGDILLLLIMLFLFLEGDNLELVITLGLMLLLSLGDEKKKKEEDQKE